MANALVIDYLALDSRHTRSISLSRDLSSSELVDHYLFTPNSVGALRQIGEGLAAGRPQRAWKIVGPYGSGKSALGVMLGQLVAGNQNYPQTAKKLASASSEVAKLYANSSRLAVPVVGSRVSFGVALAAAMDAAAKSLGKAKSLTNWQKRVDFEAGTYKNRPFNATAGEMAADFAAAISSLDRFNGVVLLIDEAGKFIEHAALYPAQADLIALQSVAEAACTANDDKLVVVSMLHQNFSSYAAGVGRSLNDEWHKVAARFEEVPFDEPIERYAHFAKHALGVKAGISKVLGLADKANAFYSNEKCEIAFGNLSTMDRKLFANAKSVYPLHPLVLCSAAVVSKRHGQSERSFHSFLNGHEPFGLRDFANKAAIGSWYCLPDFYDFLAQGYGLSFRDLAAERRWTFARAAIERITDRGDASAVLKSIAVLELAQFGVNLRITADLIAFGLGNADAAAIAPVLARLVEQGVLVKRKKIAEYGMAVSEAINIEALYERAAHSNESELLIKGISKLSQRFVVANRHYAETGTIRTMGMVVGTPTSWPKVPTNKRDETAPDAWLKLVLLSEGTDEEHQAIERIKADQDQFSISAILKLSAEGRGALTDLAIWQIVLRDVNIKRLDPWTTRYVETRLQDASENVERLVTSALIPTPGYPGPGYWHAGKEIVDSHSMNISRVSSWLFNNLYPQSPNVVNELINKDKPASAIVLARQRMFDVILSGDPKRSICGSAEFPPERLIHTTLLRDTGIWIETDGQWKLHAPAESAPVNITAVWAAISEQLTSNTPPTFADVLDHLAAPPFGVRSGPAGIWIALFLLVNRGRCAVFERGTLVLELTSEHLQRMYKNPQTFVLRERPDAQASEDLLNEYRTALSSIGCVVDAGASYLEVARTLYRWFNRLPDYTKQTLQISKDTSRVRTALAKAQDHIELFTKTLREIHIDCKSELQFADWLAQTLTDLGMAYRRLQENAVSELSKGFGISGSLSRIRGQLQAECSREASRLANAKLKSFILRCTDILLSDEKWLDSVGSLIVHKPLDAWTDETFVKFQQELTELCGHYKRWMQVVMHRGEAPAAAGRFVGLTLTLPGGEEAALFVPTNENSSMIAKDLLATLKSASKGNRDTAIAALTQALLELQGNSDATQDKGVSHG